MSYVRLAIYFLAKSYFIKQNVKTSTLRCYLLPDIEVAEQSWNIGLKLGKQWKRYIFRICLKHQKDR